MIDEENPKEINMRPFHSPIMLEVVQSEPSQISELWEVPDSDHRFFVVTQRVEGGLIEDDNLGLPSIASILRVACHSVGREDPPVINIEVYESDEYGHVDDVLPIYKLISW